jgi:CspA family cold shock protein
MSLAWRGIVANAKCRSTAVVELRTTFFARCACNVTCDRTRVRVAIPRALLAPYFCYLVGTATGFWPSSGRCVSDATIGSPTKTQVVARIAAGQQPTVRAESNLNVDETRRPTMQKGTVKWFNPTKGYGFIKPAGSDKDVFVHISAVERAGLSTLNEGQTVEYELVTGRNGKTSAENLKVA